MLFLLQILSNTKRLQFSSVGDREKRLRMRRKAMPVIHHIEPRT